MHNSREIYRLDAPNLLRDIKQIRKREYCLISNSEIKIDIDINYIYISYFI